ncbi:hypothetical protein [Reichenbachiella sp.]|uniref:hypothetical protein n=1 Tax=Reichenbachiella sp. TaxID=2184521 RepID=UPI003B5BD047
MKNLKIFTLLLVSACITFSCDEEDKLINEILVNNPIPPSPVPPTGTAGDLDLSTYVSLGASITAGVGDGTLYDLSQAYSFPALLADRFALEGVGGGVFNQPTINSADGYTGTDGTTIFGKLILDLDANNDGELGDAAIVPSTSGDIPAAYEGDKATLNNFGVGGIQTAQILTPLTGGPDAEANTAYNPYYARFASEPGVSTILGDAMARNPTFFTLFPGGNDVLGYAVSGGTKDALLTDPALVAGYIGNILDGLMSKGAKGIIMNVPNVAVLPHFQAVPRIIEVPEASREELLAGIGQINAAITGWNAAVAGSGMERPMLSTDMDNYPLLIEDESLSDAAVPNPAGGDDIVIPKIRNIVGTPIAALGGLTELVLLPALPGVSSGEIGISPLAPLEDELVLDATELGTMLPNLIAINTAIGTEATTRAGSLMYMDVNTLLTEIATGGGYSSAETGGYKLSPDFTPNGMFANDGVHLNPRGAAIMANEIIKKMNSAVADGGYGTGIPLHSDVMQFPGSTFQQ